MKKISVIILSYNSGEMLFETIDSVLKQNFEKIEIIIADDHSDLFNESAVVSYINTNKKDKNVECVISRNDVNLGTVKNLNKALNIASGDYIKIIAGDDVFPNNDIFNAHVSLLEENPNSYFVVGDIVQCDSKMKPMQTLGFFNHKINLASNPLSKKDIKRLIRFYPYLLATQAITFRKKFFEDYGLYNENYKLVEDLSFLIKVIDQNISYSYLHIESVCHRNDSGVSSNKSSHFNVKKINYYQDILNYYIWELSRYKKVVGRFFYFVKKSMAKFRIEYTKTKSKKLIFKYSPIFFFSLFLRK